MTADGLRRRLSWFVFFFVIGVAQGASAEAPRVLFVSHEQTPFSARIRAEIEAMGLQIVVADACDESGALGAGAAAQVIESPPPRRVELWLRQEDTGRLVLDRVLEAEQIEAEPGAVDATSAVRVSEQLRAFFQPLREGTATATLMPPRPPPPPLPPTKPVSAPPSTERSLASTEVQAEEGRFFQELAVGIPRQPGSLGLDLLLRTRLRFGSTYGLGAKLVLPVVSSTVSSGGNQADVSASLFGVEVSVLLATTRLITFGAHAGLAAVSLSANGHARAPYTDRVERKPAVLPSLGGELGFRLTEHVRWCLGAELGVALPQLELSFAGQNVATWGQPFALFSTGMAATWGDP
ncbi:MAG TPA: hypothetical protein VGJ91_14525 [Polyangiaceae bacterium]|jgi:hypothetical protein